MWLCEIESMISYILVWQHVQLSKQIRPRDRLACCWDVKQPANKPQEEKLQGSLYWRELGACDHLSTLQVITLWPWMYLWLTYMSSWQNGILMIALQACRCTVNAGTGWSSVRIDWGRLQVCSLTSVSVGYCLFVGCLTCQQHAGVSQGRVCSDNFTCCHTEKLQITLSTSPSHSILTPGWPVPAQTL